MKIQTNQKELLRAITLAEKVSGRNLTLPVLNCLLLTAEKKGLTVSATNLDLGIEIQLPAKVDFEGVVAVPGSILTGVVGNLAENESITLFTKEENLCIKTKAGESVIKAQPHEDFPSIPKDEDAYSLSIKVDTLLDGIKAVWYSASISSIKPELSSVYIYQNNKQLYFVATDSFRLAEKMVPCTTITDDFEPILIPLKNIPEILRVLEVVEGDVGVALTQNQIAFLYNNTYLVSRLTDATFPDYKQIIPKNTTTEAKVLKQDLVQTLKKTSIFSDSFNHTTFSLNPQKKHFSISSKNNDIGETKEDVNAALTGEPLDISFNYKYITDVFQSLHSDSVSLLFNGTARPLIIKPTSDNSFLYLVMPMNR